MREDLRLNPLLLNCSMALLKSTTFPKQINQQVDKISRIVFACMVSLSRLTNIWIIWTNDKNFPIAITLQHSTLNTASGGCWVSWMTTTSSLHLQKNQPRVSAFVNSVDHLSEEAYSGSIWNLCRANPSWQFPSTVVLDRNFEAKRQGMKLRIPETNLSIYF